MTRLFLILVFAISVGCGRSAVSPVGTWGAEVDSSKVALDQQDKVEGLKAFFTSLTIELKRGGEALLKLAGDERKTTWRQDGDRIIISAPDEGGEELTLILSADGKTMRAEFSERQLEEMSGLSVRFVKK